MQIKDLPEIAINAILALFYTENWTSEAYLSFYYEKQSNVRYAAVCRNLDVDLFKIYDIQLQHVYTVKKYTFSEAIQYIINENNPNLILMYTEEA